MRWLKLDKFTFNMDNIFCIKLLKEKIEIYSVNCSQTATLTYDSEDIATVVYKEIYEKL